MKIFDKISDRKTACLISVVLTAASAALLLYRGLVFIPLAFLLILLILAKKSRRIYSAAALLCALLCTLGSGFAAESPALAANGLLLLAALALLAAGLRLIALGGGGDAVTWFILEETQTRRGYFACLCVLSALFSAVPPFSCSIGPGLLRRAGRRMGISPEKAATLAAMTAAVISGSVLMLTLYPEILVSVRAGLDAAGGTDVPEYSFLLSSFRFLYFPMAAAVVILMSVFKLRDMGGILRAEREARKTCDPQTLRVKPDKKARRQGMLLAAGPTALALAAVAAGIELGLAVPTAALCGAGLFLLSTLLILALQKKGEVFRGVELKESLAELPADLVSAAVAIACYALAANGGIYAALASVFTEELSMLPMALLAFLLSGLAAFLSGSSFVAMTLLLPAVIPTGWFISESAIYYTMATGAVISGAMAGVLLAPHAPVNLFASVFSGCSHGSHMRRQAVYVLFCAVCAYAFGFLPISIGFTSPFGLLITVAGTYAFYETISKSPDAVKRGK